MSILSLPPHVAFSYVAPGWVSRNSDGSEKDPSMFQDVDLNHYRIGKIEGFEVLKKVKVRGLHLSLHTR